MQIFRTKILGFALLLGGLALCGMGLWLLLSPAQYQATVRIRLEPDSRGDVTSFRTNNEVIYSFDPYFIQTELKIIQSPIVLSNVVESLNLNIKWAENTAKAIKFLQRRISLQVVPNTMLIDISFSGNNPNEVARIANAIAKAYSNYRAERWKQLEQGGIQVLTKQFQKEEPEIKSKLESFEQLQRQLNLPNPEPADELLKSNYPSYFQAKHELQHLEDFHKLLANRIDEEKSNLKIPKASMVEIVGTAKPPEFPVSPNRWLGAALLAIGLFPTVGGFLLLKFAIRSG